MTFFTAAPGKKLNSKQNRSRAAVLRARDGTDCFYCLDPLGRDQTIEHIVERRHLGSNHPDNLALAHELCNMSAEGMSPDQKMLRRGDALLARLAGEPVPDHRNVAGMGYSQHAELRRALAAFGVAA